MHQLLDAHEFLAEVAAGVEGGEVLRLKSLLDQHRHRQRIAEGEHGCRARGRHKVHGARLFRDLTVQ